MTFKDLHEQKQPIVMANVWDVPSAKVAERLHFQSIGTSSGAIAAMLGYQDGEEMTFAELEYMVQRIVSSTNLPLSVDLEAGYSRDAVEITKHITKLAELGVVGINIEDSIVEQGVRKLVDVDIFSKTLQEVCTRLRNDNISMFVNVRTDSFLLGISDALDETQKRIKYYEQAGADGIFTPCIEQVSDIKTIIESTDLPINVMCMPNLPDFKTLANLGVKRISMGNFLFEQMYRQLERTTQSVLEQESFQVVF